MEALIENSRVKKKTKKKRNIKMEALALSRLHCFSGGSVCTVYAGWPQFALHERAGQGSLWKWITETDGTFQPPPSHLWVNGTQVALRRNPPAFVPIGIFETHFKEPFRSLSCECRRLFFQFAGFITYKQFPYTRMCWKMHQTSLDNFLEDNQIS